jgi:hypothetical protein
LPDGRIFNQITQNRLQNIIFGQEKSVAGKPSNLFKSCRRETEKYFIDAYRRKPPFYAIFAAFKNKSIQDFFSFFLIIFEFSILLIIFIQLKHAFLDICLEVAEFF